LRVRVEDEDLQTHKLNLLTSLFYTGKDIFHYMKTGKVQIELFKKTYFLVLSSENTCFLHQLQKKETKTINSILTTKEKTTCLAYGIFSSCSRSSKEQILLSWRSSPICNRSRVKGGGGSWTTSTLEK